MNLNIVKYLLLRLDHFNHFLYIEALTLHKFYHTPGIGASIHAVNILPK